MNVEKLIKFSRVAFAFLFGAALMCYALYGWHEEWLDDWQALIVGTIGFAFMYFPQKLEAVISKGLSRIFDATIGRFFNGGGKATVLALMVLSSFAVNAQYYNAKAYRVVHDNDSSGITGVGIIRWDRNTGKFRFWDGDSWVSFRKDTDIIGGASSVGSLDGTTKSANGAAIDGSTLYMQTADATYPGLVSTGAQTFAGSKTFAGNANFNGWVTLNSRVPIGTNSFFLADATNGFRVHNSDNTAVRFKVHNSGQTDIGGPLNVTASTGTYGTFDHSVSGAAYLNLRYNNTLYGYIGHSAGLVSGGSDTDFALRGENAIDFAIGSTRAARLTSTGLGIGTTSPALKVHALSTSGSDLFYADANGQSFGGYRIRAGAGGQQWAFRGGSTTMSLTDVTAGADRLVINTDGNSYFSGGYLGVGVVPVEKFHVYRGSTNGVIARFEGGASAFSTFIEHNASNTRIYNNLSRGFVLAPNNTDLFTFSTGGVGTATDWVATSDRRLKENIKPVGSQLEKVEAIAELVRNYDRKDNGKNETGFIAQELAEVAPEYVNEGSDSVMWSVNYSKLVVPLYAAIAELKAEIEELKAENQKLKSKRRRK